ncbi:MAG: lytic transglycosylase F [Deltaproteobacteria bacterium]|nr:lytic transglycosylase F [Deltaproteobacteria bacterium]
MFHLQFGRFSGSRSRYRWLVQFSLMIVLLITTVFITGSAAAASGKKPQQKHTMTLNQKWIGDFDGMVKDRIIRVLVVYSKTFYFLDQGRQRGISHDLLKEFEKFVNKKYKTKTLKFHVVFIPVPRDKLISDLIDGLGDIAVANLTITPQRLKHVDFSNPMLTGVKELLVTGPAASPLSAVDDLAGQEIHVRKSSSYYESLVDLNASFKKSGKPQMKLIVAEELFEDEDLLEMVNAGLIPMIVMDSHKAHFWTQIFDKIKVHDDIAVREGGEIAWAFRKNSPKLKAIVNEFIKGHKKGTLIGNMLLKRYLKSTQYVKNSLGDKEMQKFNSMVAFFKKYSGNYDFDHLMIAALAYQESGLDQSKRSHVGAVGVMQVLPSTAADKNVGIPDIEELEKNIHAGTKYLRFIIDRYYKDEPMDKLNQTLFGFASYNAGPARVRGLRKKATAMGLDPNIWFNSVEVAAAKVIGRETVQYVSNIYKYYIAYSMIVSQMEKKEQLRKKK